MKPLKMKPLKMKPRGLFACVLCWHWFINILTGCFLCAAFREFVSLHNPDAGWADIAIAASVAVFFG